MVVDMSGAGYRMLLLAGCLSVALVVLLAATTAPAFAHPHGMHDFVAVSETHASGPDRQAVEPCCHKTGTCVLQFMEFSSATGPLNRPLTTLKRSFAVARHVSIPSATDPPPPRS